MYVEMEVDYDEFLEELAEASFAFLEACLQYGDEVESQATLIIQNAAYQLQEQVLGQFFQLEQVEDCFSFDLLTYKPQLVTQMLFLPQKLLQAQAVNRLLEQGDELFSPEQLLVLSFESFLIFLLDFELVLFLSLQAETP